jgi:hypothetical protein
MPRCCCVPVAPCAAWRLNALWCKDNAGLSLKADVADKSALVKWQIGPDFAAFGTKRSHPEAVTDTPDNIMHQPHERGVDAEDDPAGGKAVMDSPKRSGRSRWVPIGVVLLVVIGALVLARAMAPRFVRWYVNRTIDQSQLYRGEIGDIDLHLWRGAYSIQDIRIFKEVGLVPVPLFAAERVDFQVQWDAILNRRMVGRILFIRPELNFVQGADDSQSQTGEEGPWLQIIQDLFPFRINSARVEDGAIHFRTTHTDPQVNVYLSNVQATVTNLTNIRDEITPLFSTVQARATAMDHADFEYQMLMNTFSYRPTFQLAVRLLNLDVTELNELTLAYGAFDFERGWFDLVIELDAKEGQLQGYVKPLFRDMQIFSMRPLLEGDPVQFFWQALLGAGGLVFRNLPRDQFGTVIPLEGDVADPETNVIAVVVNVLRNAFVRAYLPRLEGVAPDIDWLQFRPAELTDPVSAAPVQ